MARYFDVHPDNPQPRSITQVVELLRFDDGRVAQVHAWRSELPYGMTPH